MDAGLTMPEAPSRTTRPRPRPRTATRQPADERACSIGLDYGSDSVRAVLVDCRAGHILAEAVQPYRRWARGDFCDAATDRYRQHPQDYIDGLRRCLQALRRQVGKASMATVVGIGVDTTASTPVPVDAAGTPLALLPEFADNPNACFWLWKDHTSLAEAEEIGERARRSRQDVTRYSGGICSAEWFWAKLLHCLRQDRRVAAAAASWVEHCDWLPALLTGTTAPELVARSRCAAGHKALWHADWGGLPPQALLSRIDRRLAGWRKRLYGQTFTSDRAAGCLTPAWARRLGLPAGIPDAVGAIDAHVGAVGAGIRPGVLCKVMGTSTCDMLVVDPATLGERVVPGIGGQVDGSILPGLVGMEAGQGAFGDVYAWFRRLVGWGASAKRQAQLLDELGEAAAGLEPGAGGVRALDWHNGRRTPDANERVAGMLAGLRLGSDAPQCYRALVEATAFGSRAILDRFREHDVPIRRILALGGIAQRSPFVVQTLADVLGRPIGVVAADQACALGAAMFGAVVGGACKGIGAAQRRLQPAVATTYRPRKRLTRRYEELMQDYRQLGQSAEALAAMRR